GDLVGLFRLEIVDPDLIGHAAPVALPGSELTEDAVVGKFLVIGRERAEAAARQGQLLGKSAVDADGIELADEVVERAHAGAEDDVLAIDLPAADDVFGCHAVGYVISAHAAGA